MCFCFFLIKDIVYGEFIETLIEGSVLFAFVKNILYIVHP